MNVKHFVSITDLTAKEIETLLKKAIVLKKKTKAGKAPKDILRDKTMVMIFEKPSLRTRLSFEIAMTHFGGHAIYLGPSDIGLGKREATSDIAIVTSSMADIIMARTFSHAVVEELAQYSSVPVINALTDMEHPCQILADFQTILEVKKKLKGLTIAFVGDAENNVTHTMALGAAMLGINFRVGAPKGYTMDKTMAKRAYELAAKTEAKIVETNDPKEAVKGADVVVADTWVSMGDEKEKEARLKLFKPYQVTKDLMKLAKKDAMFMHCLPAYRGNEVTPEVIDGPQSYVFQEAENRLHAQKALMLYLLGKLK
ncbi:MAG: ornithine carbamoyltransferase [Candidatus Levyibacteriota bacterium]